MWCLHYSHEEAIIVIVRQEDKSLEKLSDWP